MRANYLYWDIDTTNWNGLYNMYSPIFSKLDINNVADQRLSVSYFRKMTSNLIDGHFAISFINNNLKDSSVIPASDKIIASLTFHSPFLFQSVDSNYLNKNFPAGTQQ